TAAAPPPERTTEPDRVVEVGLRPPGRRTRDIALEEPVETVAQGRGSDRDDATALVPPLAAERVGELLDLSPRDPGQFPRLPGAEPQLDAHTHRVVEEPAAQRRVDVEPRQRALDLR